MNPPLPDFPLQHFAADSANAHSELQIKLELHQLALLQKASHHLPTAPPANSWDCLAFRQICQRLIGSAYLYRHPTDSEHLFENYYNESCIGPEMMWAVYPRKILCQIPPSASDTGIFSNMSQTQDEGLEKTQSGYLASNHAPSFYEACCPISIEPQKVVNPIGVVTPPVFLPLQKPLMDHNHCAVSEAGCQLLSGFPSSTTASTRKSLALESSFEDKIAFKRRKVVWA